MHVGLLVEVHVNYLIISDLSSLFFSIYLMVELVLSLDENGFKFSGVFNK